MSDVLDGFDDGRVAMAQHIDGYTRHKIKVHFAVAIPYAGTLTM